MLTDVARGVKHLHSLDMAHGDIKASNIVLQSASRRANAVRFTAKLADLGLARMCTPSVRRFVAFWCCRSEDAEALLSWLLLTCCACQYRSVLHNARCTAFTAVCKFTSRR